MGGDIFFERFFGSQETKRRMQVALHPSPKASLIGFAFYPLLPIIVVLVCARHPTRKVRV
jgi:hypothetical protein